MLRLGKFDINGKIVGFGSYFDVYRKGEYIILEFINNAILPIRIKREDPGVYSCWVYNKRMFVENVTDNIIFHIDMYGEDINPSDIDAKIWIGYGNEHDPRGICDIRVDVYGRIELTQNKEYTTIAKEQVQSWLRRIGVDHPVGLGSGGTVFVATFGFECHNKHDAIWIKFPNGLNFPVIKTPHGCKVVGNEDFYSNQIRSIYVRVRHIDKDSVTFRLVVNSGHIYSFFDDIKYDWNCAQYRDKSVSTGVYTKMLMLADAKHQGSTCTI